MGAKPLITNTLIELTEEFLGEIIDEVLEKYYTDTELGFDYDELIEYITRELAFKNNAAGDYDKYYRMMKKLARHRPIAETLIGYLIYRFMEENKEEF